MASNDSTSKCARATAHLHVAYLLEFRACAHFSLYELAITDLSVILTISLFNCQSVCFSDHNSVAAAATNNTCSRSKEAGGPTTTVELCLIQGGIVGDLWWLLSNWSLRHPLSRQCTHLTIRSKNQRKNISECVASRSVVH